MALTSFKGDSIPLFDAMFLSSGIPAYRVNGLIDAAGEKFAICGCVWHPTIKTGTINIRKIHFRTGAVTFNALSTMRVSLQNYDLTAGPVYRPDGVQDQTYDFVGAGLASNSWVSTGNLSSDRAVDLSADSVGDANSRYLCVVMEYQTFTAADSIIISTIDRGLGVGVTTPDVLLGGPVLQTAGTWNLLNAAGPVIALECDDGTLAFLDTSYPYSALGNITTANNAAIRAAGLKFRFPVEVAIDALGLYLADPNGCDGTITLYDTDGTTVLREFVIDNDAVAGTAGRGGIGRVNPVTLTANSYYRMVFVPTTTTAATIYYGDVNSAAHMDGLIGGQDFHWTQRDSVGAWTDTTTRRPFSFMKLQSVHDGSGGGGNTYSRGRVVNQ